MGDNLVPNAVEPRSRPWLSAWRPRSRIGARARSASCWSGGVLGDASWQTTRRHYARNWL